MKNWTADEERKLIEFKANNTPLEDQAKELGRTVKAIISKRHTLGLSRKSTLTLVTVQEPEDATAVETQGRVWRIIARGAKASVSSLADELDQPPKAVRAALDALKKKGKSIFSEGDTVWVGAPTVGGSTVKQSDIDLDQYNGRLLRFGLTSDNHMCSRYERMDVVNALYDIFAAEGIKDVYNCGNWIDGEARFNKNDIHTHGLGNQFRYFAKNFPKREGIDTYIIGGDDHEGWYVQREGIDIGKMVESYCDEEGRTDIHYLGYMEHDIVIPAPNGETRIRLMHPGGGTAYALSYQPQKLIESLTGGEKPEILLIGHYHKAEYLHYRNIHCFQAGCTCDQTPFMRKKRLSAHVGGWIIEAWQADDGSIRRVRSQWINFFDKEFHVKESAWKYQMEDREAA